MCADPAGGGRSALASQPGPAGGYMQEHPQEQGRSPKKSRDIAGTRSGPPTGRFGQGTGRDYTKWTAVLIGMRE